MNEAAKAAAAITSWHVVVVIFEYFEQLSQHFSIVQEHFVFFSAFNAFLHSVSLLRLTARLFGSFRLHISDLFIFFFILLFLELRNILQLSTSFGSYSVAALHAGGGAVAGK